MQCQAGIYHTYLHREAQIVERASIFKSNKSQALRLPNPVAYPDTVKQVDIVIQGLVVVTNNTKKFENVPAIRLANWVD